MNTATTTTLAATRFSTMAPLIAVAVLATACVTINIYFPASAAEKAADKIIDEVWLTPAASGTATPSTLPAPAAPATPVEAPEKK